MYDFTNNYTIPNSFNRYALGSDDKMKLNGDGSLTIYIQHDKPSADQEANWLPSPTGQFYVAIRAYPPGPALLKSPNSPGAYPRPPLIRIK